MKELYGEIDMHENEVKIFEFEQQGVETIFLDGEPLFNPYHVGKCLGLSDSAIRMNLSGMDDDERIILKNLDVNNIDIRKFNNRGEVFLKEPGLYHLIFESRKPEAKKFKKWVVTEVLPSIRQTGSYSLESNTNRLLNNLLENTETLLGVRRDELAIFQQESYNKKLSNLMVDCARNGMGSMSYLYDELYYVFASETGIDIPEIAELKRMRPRDYLRKNQSIAKTVYEFALKHFARHDRQIILVPSQSLMDDFYSKKIKES